MTPEELLSKLDFKKGNGLIPVITQDAKTKAVLMQAFANTEAVELTLKTKKATYWSRSRNELWVKGETSGHTQKIVSVTTDCDYDSLLYVVEQNGPACHTGEYSCFYNKLL
jgi:phosphoribosyl-ATP pyrophosphohydrolase/phosphoribosyl-AMP cyclohydrolase